MGFLKFFTILGFSVTALAAPKYGPEGNPIATPLSAKTNTQYFRNNEAPDYWSLAPYYIPQETKSGCSAANFSMILNAARDARKLGSADELVSFKNLIKNYTSREYRKAIEGGFQPSGEIFSNKNLTAVLEQAVEKLKYL